MPTFNNKDDYTNDVIRHVSPNAYVIFVPAFNDNIILSEAIVTDSYRNPTELVSVSVSLTVRNSPGTFNIAIRDPYNKFIEEDDANAEIKLLRDYSQKKSYEVMQGTQGDQTDKVTLVSAREQKTKTQSTTDPNTGATIPGTETTTHPTRDWYVKDSNDPKTGNYYNYEDYTKWSNDYIIVLEGIEGTNKGRRYPTQFTRDNVGSTKAADGTPIIKVKERWAFTDTGDIIYVTLASANKVKGIGTETELINEFDDAKSNAITKTLAISTYKDSAITTEDFIVHRYYNKDLVSSSFRDVDEQGPVGSAIFKKGNCRINPMDRIMIFMTPRFDDNGNFNQSDVAPMIPVFTGVVNLVQQSYSDGAHTITVQGEDITKYLRLSIINVNPALNAFNKEIAGQYPGENIHVWGQIFQGLKTPEIIRVLCLGTGELRNARELMGQKIDGIGFYKLSGKGDSAAYWTVDPTTDTWKKDTGGPAATASFKAVLGDLFKSSSVHICDPYRQGELSLVGFRPYEMSLDNNWSFFQADFKTRRDIAYKAAEDSLFAFYADRAGHIWFHPYRYDISWILGAKNPKVYVIDNPSIISYGFVDDDSDLYTEVQVSTEPDFGQEGIADTGFYTGVFRSEADILRYGYRIFVGVNPIINTKSIAGAGSGEQQASNKEWAARSVKMFAKSLLQRILASKCQGQITIVGRPEIDPGRPIYIPIRNMIYYVETVDHDLSFGSNFTTTLHLSYGRKPWEFLPELLTFAEKDEVYLTASGLKTSRRTTDNNDSVDDGVRRGIINGIMIHHTQDINAVKGEVANIDYNSDGYRGSPYDVIINKDGSTDLSPRWTSSNASGPYLSDVGTVDITKYKEHYKSAFGNTEEERVDIMHIAVAGDFDATAPSAVQIHALVIKVASIAGSWRIDPRSQLFFHSDKDSVSCPGRNFPSKQSIIEQVLNDSNYVALVSKYPLA